MDEISSDCACMTVKTSKKKERNFPELQLNEQSNVFNQNDANGQPILVIQSPKTPTLSRKQKASSLDSENSTQKQNLEVSRDVFSVPNTPKKQAKTTKIESNNFIGEFEDNDCISAEFNQRLMLTPLLGNNLKKFASNSSISGSQTLKTLPEVMTLQEFSGTKIEPVRIKAKGLLERRGSNASLTIDLGSNLNLNETKTVPIKQIPRLNTAKSVSNLNLSSFGYEKCLCSDKCQTTTTNNETATNNQTKKLVHNETCNNCTIYESIPSNSNPKKPFTPIKHNDNLCKCNLKFLPRCYVERHCVCNLKYRRKSLSNENLYVPPCNFCHFGSKDCHLSSKIFNKGSRKALYPRQTYIETSQLLSEDFKLHLQNIQYLQTAGSVLSIAELKSCCQMEKIPRLHQEFWEVPLNLQEKCLVSGSQSKNRYKGVLPNEHSRVHLPGPQPYIHANYIKGPDYTETAYIATQGPMSHTCEDFWNMIWNNKVNRIVMLTALIERGRSKCELYFPLGEAGETKNALYSDGTSFQGLIETCSAQDNSNSTQFGSYSDESSFVELENKNVQQWGAFTIKYLSKELLGECIIRKLEIIKQNDDDDDEDVSNVEKRVLLHYWYPNWADHKLANPEQVLQIALHVLDINSGLNVVPSSSATDSSSSASAILNSSSSSDLEMAGPSRNKFNFEFIHETIGKTDEASIKYPIVVHCSAGIGRTGCFLAILNGIHQLRTNFNVDILAIVCSLRLNRGGMVQTAEQYELIHRVLSLYTDMI